MLQEQGIRTALVDSDQQNIYASKRAGLEAAYGDALSELIFDELELGGIGRMLAMTTNNEVNSLAVLQFQEVFGRAEVYQLATDNLARGQETIAPHFRGRILFNSSITCGQIQQKISQGANIQKSHLTPDFDFLALQSLYNGEAIPLLLINDKKQLTIFTEDEQPLPRPGETLISLVPAINSVGIQVPADGPADRD
jgi:hypothetical protein